MWSCSRCDRNFSSHHALEQHLEDSPRHHFCRDCNRNFTTKTALTHHWRDSSKHSYCEDCDELFDDDDELEEHWFKSSSHFYCQECDEHFDDDDELEDHLEDNHFYCSTCSQVSLTVDRDVRSHSTLRTQLFTTEDGLHQHNSRKHWYCASCRRLFQTENNLHTHLRSSAHQPRRLRCPGSRCKASFITEAGLVLHCESGACRSGVTRRAVDRVVTSVDRGNIITDPTKMIEALNAPITEIWATSQSWNGKAFECILCHREFTDLTRLNQHLHSPAHENTKYLCPPAWNGCKTQFKTLSGLMQHVESETCGVAKFKQRFKNVVHDVTTGMGMLSL